MCKRLTFTLIRVVATRIERRVADRGRGVSRARIFSDTTELGQRFRRGWGVGGLIGGRTGLRQRYRYREP
jgi:hypothetical protein